MAAGGRYAELWRSQTEKTQVVARGPAVVERINTGAPTLAV
jgi:hypothetical protein